jgi:anaerobic selenocysteine-containing dehydrogenase
MEAPLIQYTDPVTPPPPGVLNEWEFFNGVANRLGFTLRATPGAFAFNPGKTASAKAIDPQETWTTERLIEAAFADVGLSLDEVRRHPHGLKVEYPPQTISAPEADDGARLDVCPPDVAGELAEIFAAAAPVTQDYLLVPRRIIELMNSEFRFAGTTVRRFDGAAPLYMHPEDMSQEGFAPDDRISITGKYGQISARVRPDPTMRRGVVAMTHCWSGDPDGEPTEGHTSRLVSMQIEDVQKIDGMPMQSSLPVKLGKAVMA